MEDSSDDDEVGGQLQRLFFEEEDLIHLQLLIASQANVRNNYRSALSLQNRRNRSGKIRRRSLLQPTCSAFMHLYNGQQDDALITTTGFNYATFNQLLDLFAPVFLRYTPHVVSGSNIMQLPNHLRRRGRCRTISPIIALALVLVWTRTRGSYATLQLIFGMTASSISRWLRFCKRVLLLVLLDVAEAQIRMPSDEKIREYQDAIKIKYPSLQHCWGAMDGVKINIEAPGDDIKQSRFYNGWTHGHYVANLFLFTPDGRICAAYLNSPGTTHDSTMANLSKIYNQIDEVYHRMGGRAKVVVDSAFASEERLSLIKSFQNNIGRNGALRQNRQVNNEATAVRQLSEWGMRGFQSSFPRLKEKIKYEERGERKIMLNLMVLLYNFRVSKVGQNQIRSVYMPQLDQNVTNIIQV
jgi:DDE superfamily endonuclease